MASEGEGSETGIRRQMSNLMSSIKLFSYMDIERATNYLSESSRMWTWRYGRYYKGYLDDSTEVYIKMLDPKLPKDEAAFIQELNVLKDLRHPNLPELVGACIEHPAVFYKFPTYENLELCLENRPGLLTWQIRTSIIYQICSALIFLYSYKQGRPIIHGHLTPANILLDGNFNCRVLIPEGTATSNPNPVGRFTEYIERRNRKLGDDVYSLGIMVLRLLTGSPAATVEGQAHGARIVEWLMNNVDHTAGNWPPELVEELAYFGPKCCYSSKSNLLKMEDIKKELANFIAMPMMDNFKNKETILCSDYKDSKSIISDYKHSKSIRIEETCGTTTEDKNSYILISTSSVKVFSYTDIESATNGLSESSKIGQGGYGSVYKGYLDNTEVAIKILDTTNDEQGEEEFIRELAVLGQIRHPNFVKLIGACFIHHSLVYEFLPNGSLEDCLKNSPSLLAWQLRTRIVYEICSALIFLHSNEPQPIVHGDLKPANILLDTNFNIKLTDFGLCRFLPKGTNTVAFYQTSNIKGTEWYIDPDFLETGKLSPGCDVYSFGITILRILTGKSPVGIFRKVCTAYDKQLLMKIVDSTSGPWPDHVAEYLARIGLRCCEPEGGRSELMMEISSGLENILAEIDY